MSESGEPSDEELARAAAGGNHAAFHQLYHRHKRMVFARLTKLIGADPEREDVLQLIFYQLYLSLPRFRAESTLSTYLYRITSNVACDHLRKRTRLLPMVLDEQALDELAASVPDPIDRSHARRQLETLFDLLDHVKPKRRVAFVLVAIEGLTHDAAAEQLGITPQAVKLQVIRAREQLTGMVERQERREAQMAWRTA